VMEVIMSLAQRVLVFNQGRVIASGAPRDVVQDAEVIRAYLGQTQWIAAAPRAAVP
jgi:branched-chain amino acid transport system ATP-binding protein